MSQLDALRLVESTRRRLVDLAVSENFMRSPTMAAAAETIWAGPGERGGLVSDLWIQGAFPSRESADSLGTLDAQGLFPTELRGYLDSHGKFPADRKLFTHQSAAIHALARPQAADHQPSVVVTAGTGAGKTEAFLLPVLSGLWRTPRFAGEGGMRCLILYPMNALVTDQVTRLYDLLEEQAKLSLFHFTSETPESDRKAKIHERWKACRPWSRESARANVPDIVITNYSMLEYMLCRPQDAPFFGPALRYIVLDEAHLYAGTLAAEITLLLRRVRDRCGVAASQIAHIATSATLGGSDADLRRFASTIFSVPERVVELIKGEPSPLPPARVLAEALPPSAEELARDCDIDVVTLSADGEFVNGDESTQTRLQTVVQKLLPDSAIAAAEATSGRIPARFLYSCLEQVPLIRRLTEIVYDEGLLSMHSLCERLWGRADESARKGTTLLLRLAAMARVSPKTSPLLPHRLHFLVRAPQGLCACLNPSCSGPKETAAEQLGSLQELRDFCVYCHCVTLPVQRCRACGQWALAGHEDQAHGRVEADYFTEARRRRYYLVTDSKEGSLTQVIVNPSSGEYKGVGEGTRLFRAPCPEHGSNCNDPDACNQQMCPTCRTPWTKITDEYELSAPIQPMRGAERLALGVAAETALSAMPEYPDKSKGWKPAQGRRLLCFSDSRREAARLGPLLTNQHETWVIRAAITETLQRMPAGPSTYQLKLLKRYETDSTDPEAPDRDRAEAQGELDKLRREIKGAEEGLLLTEFAKELAKCDGLAEILDRELGEKHSEWTQDLWKRNKKNVEERAEALIAQELDNPLRTAISVEACGLVEVAYPGVGGLRLPATFSGLVTSPVRDALSGVWPEFLAALLDTLRADRAVDWSADEEHRKWNGESPLYGRWSTRNQNGWTARRFVGESTEQLRMKFAGRVLAASGCVEDRAAEILEAAFDQLYDAAEKRALPWLKREVHQVSAKQEDRAIQLLLDQLRLRAPRALYRCPDTGTLWPRSVWGWAPLRGCMGHLGSIGSDEVDQDRRWGRPRRELRESPIFRLGLWGEEHSAQLSPEENKTRQFLFREGARNLLSSTTTMELGIDIGGLNGVMLGNVPPSRANHMQRAGRAGRRSDGSSVVVTFARNRAFDREVFSRFDDYLRKPFRRPVVFMERERFSRRHLHALILGEFFAPYQAARTGAMDAYSTMGRLCSVDAPPNWQGTSKPGWSFTQGGQDREFVRFLDSLKEDGHAMRARCSSLAANTPLASKIENSDEWARFLEEAAGKFCEDVDTWKRDFDSLRDAWKETPDTPSAQTLGAERAKANSIRYQIGAIADIKVIEWLSDSGFLPRYGFPIHLQRLSVRVPRGGSAGKSVASANYRLERQSLLALSEYVPGAQVLVGGKLVESKGIMKHWTEANRNEALGLDFWALKCVDGHDYLGTSRDEKCKECNQSPQGPGQALMFPRFGYTTAGWEPPKPPGRNLDRVGEVVLTTAGGFSLAADPRVQHDFAGFQGLRATYYEAGAAELLMRNAGGDAFSRQGDGFAVCTRCGFAMSEEYPPNRKGKPLPTNFQDHASVFSTDPKSRCWPKQRGEDPVLRHKVLAARETTDILILEWPADSEEVSLFSLGGALVLAGGRLLELDSRELGVELKRTEGGRLSLLLYDTSPGGAGHCLELLNLGRKWLEESQAILRGTPAHDSLCRRACLDCLLDFGGQFKAHLLDRHGALRMLDDALGRTSPTNLPTGFSEH